MSLINDALKRARQAQNRPAASPSGEAVLTAAPPLQPVEDTGWEKPQRLLVVISLLVLSLGASAWLLWKWKSVEAKVAATASAAKSIEIQPARPVKTNAVALAAATLAKWQSRQESQSSEATPLAQSSPPAESQEIAVQPTDVSAVNVPARAQTSSVSRSTSSDSLSGAASVLEGSVRSATVNLPAPALSNAPPPATVVSSLTTPVSTLPVASPSPGLANNAPAPPATPAPMTETQPVPKLQGIFYRLKRPTALIDGRTVSIGDDINGYRVTGIERDAVKLLGAGRTNTLSLH